MVQPPLLQKGDFIGIAATARKVSSEDLSFALDIIEKRGYRVILASNIYSEYYQFAGTDEERKRGLQELLDNPEVKAIFVARGGYGTVRIIDYLNFEKLKEYPKWICGFSDITALHAHVFNLGIQSVHSTMPVLFSKSEIAVQSLFDLLEGHSVNYTFQSHCLNKLGCSEGYLVGGNLSVLYSLSGSSSQMDLKNKILFIEDVDEYLYHIDRMLMQMKRAGFLKNLKGLVVGGFTDMKDNTVPFGKTAEEIIYDAVKEYDYPVCFNFPAGHITDNLAFIHGKKINLIVNKNEVKVFYTENS
ncbi:MAG: LD-carboxypeptidase [Bacteroidia bacterium]|nr:LD-carboxypeptidase [Bacteroidia bacterium]